MCGICDTFGHCNSDICHHKSQQVFTKTCKNTHQHNLLIKINRFRFFGASYARHADNSRVFSHLHLATFESLCTANFGQHFDHSISIHTLTSCAQIKQKRTVFVLHRIILHANVFHHSRKHGTRLSNKFNSLLHSHTGILSMK